MAIETEFRGVCYKHPPFSIGTMGIMAGCTTHIKGWMDMFLCKDSLIMAVVA